MLYLASQSPRRQALLAQIGVTFEILDIDDFAAASGGMRPAVAEIPKAGETPPAYVRRMARAKAVMGMRRLRQRQWPLHPVLGADTEVVLAGRIFGKPQDRQAAAAMLQALSGKTHEVLSGIALCLPRSEKRGPRTIDAVVVSRVTFKTLRTADIDAYLDSGEPFGKAGAYAIQGRAGAFVTRLEGSYSGVVGLPLFETEQLLEAAFSPAVVAS